MNVDLRKKQKNKIQKEKKLSSEIAKTVSIVLAVIFIIMISTAMVLSSRSITSAINAEFEEASSSADAKVENILASAETAANSIVSYLEKAYQYSEEGKKNMSGAAKGNDAVAYTSAIYHKQITEMSSDVEKYITEVVRQTSKNNSDIVGMGVLFEPYAFDSGIQDYAFYVLGEKSDGDIEPYGAYTDYSAEEYYSKAAASMSPEFTEPYEDQGVVMVTYCVPIVYNNELKGIITADINVSNFSKIASANNTYESKYITVLNENETVVYDTDSEENVGSTLGSFVEPEYRSIIQEKMKGEDPFSLSVKRADGVKESCYYSPITCGDIKWWVLTALTTSDKNKAVTVTFIILLLMMVASLVLVTWIVFYLLKKMLKPIDKVVVAAEHIAQGDLDIEIRAETNDEIGKLANAFEQTILALKNIIEDESYLLKEMARGNFDVKTMAEESYRGNYAPILVSLREINQGLSDTLGQINVASGQVSAASNQMADASQTLAEGSTEQASAVEELLATINEVTLQVEQNAEDVAQVSKKADMAGESARESNTQMEEMTEAMGKISEAAKQISAIISAIESIASQTNLLSLNAAIEAASAGEAGKGFAVVAEEIRQLAGQSSKAANNTRTLIETTIKEVENGSRIVDITAKSMEKVTEGVGEIVQIADAVRDSSERQAASMEEVTNGIEQISEVVQSNSATAEESSATSEELSAQAEELKNLVGRFKLKKE